MSRIKVQAQYESGVVRLVGSEGECFRTLTKNEIFPIGNSIGAFIAREVEKNSKVYLECVSISGSERHFPLDQLLKRIQDRKGLILYPREQVLWATTSGSARNGLFHRIREEKDPLKKFLREKLHISTKILTYFDEKFEYKNVPDGGKGCDHVSSGNDHRYSTDGTSYLVREAEYAHNHRNHYHEGCQISPEYYDVKGASYLILEHREVPYSWKLEAIYIQKDVPASTIITLLKNLGYGGD